MGQLLAGSPSNWGRWGPSDEVGALNFLGNKEVLRGVRAIKQGQGLHLRGANRAAGRRSYLAGPVSDPRA